MTRPSIDLLSAGKEEERPEEITTEGARQSCIIAEANKGRLREAVPAVQAKSEG